MVHPRPFYYLENFRTALACLCERYDDLLDEAERAFVARFHALPRESAALLVRMIGRKGALFRTSRLGYAEIGCPREAAGLLIALGWVDCQPMLTFDELRRLLRKSELLCCISESQHSERTLVDWWPDAPDVVYRVVVRPLVDRLKLLYFGNFRQDWSQFVLTDLGIFRYEKVPCDAATRAFHTRAHVDTFYSLFLCRQQLEETDDIQSVLRMLPPAVTDNEWLEDRRRKLQFRIGQCCEKQGDFPGALQIYRECAYPGSRLRVVRLLERLGRIEEALPLANLIRAEPADEIETQQLCRMWPRLRRKAGLSAQRGRASRDWPTFDVMLPVAERPACLEQATAAALSQPDGPVHYVENGLINSLFGLLCWDAIFAPIAGAFFHEFQSAPADLYAAAFHGRRAAQFAQCLGQLGSDVYHHTIYRNFQQKAAIQSPFVYWDLLSEALLRVALDCLPREHLRVCFERLLANIRANTSGWPDLVQFWPAKRRYRLIEVKGPGDRLQDNQIRWLTFCAAHGIPVSVCHVSW